MAARAVNEQTATSARSKSELAYQWIRERIASGKFSPGYRLVLGSIAKQLEVSPVPVREAIRRLEAEGLVTFERNVGATVAMVDEQEYEYAMQTLAVVEGAATGFASSRISDLELARARSINDRMAASLTDFDPHYFTRLNQEFHEILFASCPNPNLLATVRRCWVRLDSLRDTIFSFVPGRPGTSVAEHEHLLHLIETKADEAIIESATRAHRLATLAAYLEGRGR